MLKNTYTRPVYPGSEANITFSPEMTIPASNIGGYYDVATLSNAWGRFWMVVDPSCDVDYT